jgi:hypothetical protein
MNQRVPIVSAQELQQKQVVSFLQQTSVLCCIPHGATYGPRAEIGEKKSNSHVQVVIMLPSGTPCPTFAASGYFMALKRQRESMQSREMDEHLHLLREDAWKEYGGVILTASLYRMQNLLFLLLSL